MIFGVGTDLCGIARFERMLAETGTVIVKVFLHISKEEQRQRLQERLDDPDKQWKITDEDWRNRSKWDQYEQAVDEMIVKTSTQYAPWIIVSGNNKYYARIQVLRSVVEAIEKKMDERE